MARARAACFAGVLLAVLLSPASAADTYTVDGLVDVMAAIYVDPRKADCGGIHLKKDFLMLTPTTVNGTNVTDAPWRTIATGNNLDEKYKVLTGDKVQATLRNASTDSTGNRRLLSDAPEDELIDLTLTEPVTGAKEIYTNETIRVRSTIYIIETCGWKASTTVAAVRKLFWKNESSGAPNIEDYHSMCSYGKVVANGSETYIMGPIQVPCSGTVSSGVIKYSYDGSKACGAAEQFAWRMAGENFAKSIGLGDWMNATQRRRIVTVLPKEVTCGWAGLGSVGCGGRACTVYIKGGYGLTLTVQMHELGHTQGLSHAGRGLDEYGDRSDVMGSTGGADGYLCVNPGNQLRLGWNSPIGYLTPATVNEAPTNTGQRGIWRLPNMAFTDVNHVYINMTVPGFPYANHYVSFRARTPTYDAILSNDYNNRVHIHQFNGTTYDRDYNRTLLMALLGPGQWYMSRFVGYGAGTAAGGALNFSVISIDSGREAIVRICRASVATEAKIPGGDDTCCDGIDNDCDGLMDLDDPDCASATCDIARSPPPGTTARSPPPLGPFTPTACQPTPTSLTTPTAAASLPLTTASPFAPGVPTPDCSLVPSSPRLAAAWCPGALARAPALGALAPVLPQPARAAAAQPPSSPTSVAPAEPQPAQVSALPAVDSA
ncbi:hypothetical protein HYH03_006016 [Edaphochlamys debaryana]|uniref:Peptidase M11 gametolysin domain-containing protein n=1 Tax=Edaphochlamys debaryana TaxID=47281 RepID=A0A835Y7T1_9CHLO|nr:hypothetical protein HYH03_006016 [Edaphochlamys debaryana]|eukprot:KAG2495771.1 hypothetical protein HYH03_006016 [Edaphochlamys debaryana]